MDIAEEIVSSTVCNYGYHCLEDINNLQCQVTDCVDNKVFFVKNCALFCGHKVPFGNSNTCNCAVRQEIYRKYKE